MPGKSTTLGVLTKGQLDDGRGFQHRDAAARPTFFLLEGHHLLSMLMREYRVGPVTSGQEIVGVFVGRRVRAHRDELGRML